MSKVILDPAAQEFADATSQPPFLFELPPKEGRDIFAGVQKVSLAYEEGITSEWIENTEFKAKLIKPTSVKSSTLPVVMYIHGGGWVFGSTGAFGRLLGELAKHSEAAVVALEYELSPEAKFPAALEHAWALFNYIKKNGKDHGLDSSRVVIAGDSVGGNMTTVTSLRAGKDQVKGQVLFYPVCDWSFDSESYHQFAKGYFLQRDAMKWFFDNYTEGVKADPNDPRISPLRTPIEDLKNSPPAVLITCECDVLRDHGEQYAKRLLEAGVQVTSARFGGIIHDFMLLDPLKDTGAFAGSLALSTGQIKRWFA